MGERDAFGREKGEDSLAGLGWQVSGNTPATPAPVPVAAERPPAAASVQFQPPPEADRPAAQPAQVWRVDVPRRRRFPIIRLLLTLGVVIAAFIGAGTAIDRGRSALDGAQRAIDQATALPTATPAGVDAGSLYRPAALRAALKKLPAGSIQSLRVAPERINAQVTVDGKMHVVQVTSGGEVSDVATPAGGGGERLRVDPAAPMRIVRTAARRAGRKPESVSYLVLMNFSDAPQWQLFFDDGLHFSASANGRKVRRVG